MSIEAKTRAEREGGRSESSLFIASEGEKKGKGRKKGREGKEQKERKKKKKETPTVGPQGDNMVNPTGGRDIARIRRHR